MSLIDELSKIVGEKVFKTRHGYLITITKPIRSNPVIAPSKNAFKVRSAMFDNLPVGFQLTQKNGWVKQYWTVNGDRHSTTGPAVVNLFNLGNTTRMLHLKYYENDKLHRIGGPSSELLTNIAFSRDSDGLIRESVDKAEMGWCVNGEETGKPQRVYTKNMVRTRNDRGEILRVQAELYEGVWVYHKTDENSNTLRPVEIKIRDLDEQWENGTLVQRTGVFTDSTWRFNTTYQFNEESGYPQDAYLGMFNLWGEPFFTDTSIEYLMIDELQRVRSV